MLFGAVALRKMHPSYSEDEDEAPTTAAAARSHIYDDILNFSMSPVR
jgi:hypothetical protein